MTSISILSLAGTASQAGTLYATFDYTFPAGSPFTTPAGANPGAYSTMVTPVHLVQGATGSLGLAATTSEGLDIVRIFPSLAKHLFLIARFIISGNY